MQEYIRENFADKLDLPPVEGECTMFEYFIGDKGEWVHWDEKVCTYIDRIVLYIRKEQS